MHVRVVRFKGGCAFWSKRVVLGVVRRLCAHCPGIPPFRTEACLNFFSTFPMTPYYAPALPVTSHYYPLLLPRTP